MEIPDVIAINKMDTCRQDDARRGALDPRLVDLEGREPRLETAIVLTRRCAGLVPGTEKVEEHRAYRAGGQLEERRSGLAREVFAVAARRASRHLEQAVADDAELRRLLAEVQARELDPLTAVREILEKVFRIHDGDGDRTRAS